MKIWFDADNAPHVLVMKPLAEELVRRGHEVFFTARERSSTCGLLDLYGFSYVKVGGGSVRGMAGKVLGTLRRGLYLARVGKRWRPDVSFGHGSRALPVASRLIGVPSVTMYDYEWVSPAIFNLLCSAILLPEAIGPERAHEAGIDVEKARFFPGLKEEIYLSGWIPDLAIPAALGLRDGCVKILLRPPAVSAHYHNPLSETICEEFLRRVLPLPGVQLVFVPRDGGTVPAGIPGGAEIILPSEAVDGPSLLWNMDLVVGGGGTMTREAAVLRIPSVSFFAGRPGAVDSMLEERGQLVILRSPDAVRALPLRMRPIEPAAPPAGSLASKIAELMLG
jgi:predicted glycosyltransferase